MLSVQFTIAQLRESGQTVGMAAIIRDVTKQFKEARELKRALSNLPAAPTNATQ
jgi:signal transduction histidine kinase